MATINKVRLTNIVYEDGNKRFNDEIFHFNGNNSAIVLENGGGKTVFIHTVLQAILPHTNLGERKIKDTLQLENAPAHIGIEWMTSEHPRHYVATVVSLYLQDNTLHSLKYVYAYEEGDRHRLEQMPFVRQIDDKKRPATREEMAEYFSSMKSTSMNAATFDTNKSFHEYIEQNYHIITNEWQSIVKINSDEGGIEQFFEHCKTTNDLFNRLLIPTVEDSIAGHEAGKFADIFEDRREGFKMYRDFQRSIKEHEMIQQEIDGYVDQFASYSEVESTYERTKQRAKGIDLFLQKEMKEIEKAKIAGEQALEKNRLEKQELQREKATYDILTERKVQQSLEQKYYKKQATYEEVKETIAKQKHERATLQYAEKKQQLTIYNEQKRAYEQELKERDKVGTVAELQSKREEVDAHIHGFYVTKMEALEKIISETKIEQGPLQETLQKIEQDITTKEQAQRKIEREFDRTGGNIQSNIDQINQYKQRILANPDKENLETRYDEWLKEQTELDAAIVKAKNTIHLKKSERIQVDEAIQASREQLHETKLNREKTSYEQAQLDEAHDETVAKLATIHATWQGIEDLYLQESSITNRLLEMKQQRMNEREQILLKERLAHRFTDDYGKQTYFFTDPFLYEKIRDWQNDLFIQLGTEYVAGLQEAEKANAGTHPLWPLTIVTIATDKETLERRIVSIKDKLQHPVIIVTIEQAKEMTTIQQTPERWITPAHWDRNIDSTVFSDWQLEVKAEAKEATTKREAADKSVEQINHIIDFVRRFFTEYPKETKDLLRKTINEQQQTEATIERNITKLNETMTRIETTITNSENEITEKQDKLKGIEHQIEIANDIFQLKRTNETLAEKQTERTKQIDIYKREITNLRRMKVRYESDIARLQEKIDDNKQAITLLLREELYKEVNQTQPQFTDVAIEVLREKRRDLIFEIEGIERQHGEIRVKINNAQEHIARIKAEKKEINRIFSDIDTTYTFPVDGKNRINRLNETIEKDKATIDELYEVVSEAKSAYDKQSGNVGAKEKQFDKEFPNEALASFTMELEKVAPYLQEQERAITEQKNYLEKRLAHTLDERNQIEQAMRKLENFKEAHDFHRTNVTAIDLTEREQTDFSYNRYERVTDITDQLKENKKALTSERETLDRAKHTFENFCRRNITDRKLQQAAIEGMETKETYDDILNYKRDMYTRLENANKYAHDFIAKNDKDVQAFINNIHNHLINVTDELKAIPNKTRVKVENNMRNIYHFTIPEWTEEDGKSRLREHLDWILSQLEKDHFQNEYGEEDAGKVRKQIEAWLETKSLLQVVMQTERMRISCRKVTNDNQVTSRLTPWEQSNQWSGGEKWSKNMTLFLGLLNFVAEKKKQYNPHMRRNRAVILDNPFGKASSDHVLNPVFFIAEQLGFQMIALTAHADGKFLQDYFPIMYSLRLRNTGDGSKQVMETERKLHYAYFEDHEPEALERLERREQMGFDMGE